MSGTDQDADSANANAAEDGADTRSGSLMDAGEVHAEGNAGTNNSLAGSYQSVPVSVQLSDTAMRMISEMLSGQNMFRDDYFDNIYPCIEREEIYSQRDSSKVYKVSQSQAIKRIDMNLEQDYTDRSISDLSRNDTVGIGCFLQTCQEAVLQYDLFKGHDNIAQVHDRWIQANPDQHGTTLEAKPMLDVINYFKQKMENKSPMFTETIRQALKNIRGMSLFLVMDYFEKNLLRWSEEFQDKPSSYDAIPQMLDVAEKIISGLLLVHAKGYLHMDLKPANILLRIRDGKVEDVVLADFGLARELTEGEAGENEGLCGTHPYNICPDTHYTQKYDIWGLGIVFYHMVACITGRSAVSCTDLVKVIKDAKQGKLEEKLDGFDENLRDLILHCFTPDLEQRPCSKDLYTFIL